MVKALLITVIVLITSVQFVFGQINNNGTNSLLVSELSALNEYLHTLTITDFKNIEVKDGYIYVMYEGGLYEKASVGDIQNVEVDKNSNTIYLNCTNNSNCVYSTIEKKYYNSITISVNLQEDLSEAEATFEDFLIALVVDKIQPGVSLVEKTDTVTKPTTAATTITKPTTTTTAYPTTTTAAKITTTQEATSEYKINYGEKLIYPKQTLDKLKAPYEATTEKNRRIHEEYVNSLKNSGSGTSATQQALADLNKFLLDHTDTKPLKIGGGIIQWYQNGGEFTYIAAEHLGEVQIENYNRDFGSVKVKCKGTSPCFYKLEGGKQGNPIYSYISVKIINAADVKVLKKRLDNFIASFGSTSTTTPIKPKEINASFNYQLTSLNGQPKAGQAATYEVTPITITVSGSKMMISKYGSFTITGFKQNKNGSFGYGLSGSNTFVEFHVTSDNSRAVLYTADGKGSVQFSKQPFKTDNDTNKSHAQTLKGFGNTNTNNNLSLLKQTQELSLYKDSVSNKYGFKGLFGRVAVEPKYDEAVKFAGGMARVKLNGKWGYIDATGKEVIPPKYERAEDFTNGKGKVTLNGKNFYIDKTGKKIE
jgi:hypothetical protein